MSPRDWRLRAQDILDAICAIQTYTVGMDYPAFAHDRKTIDAVLRNIAIIGEAASRIPEELQLASSDIPWADMRDMRNVVIHEYFGINKQILWDTIQADLPPLVIPLQALLRTNPGTGGQGSPAGEDLLD
jgi:uncharacterized protein with HEPN domain